MVSHSGHGASRKFSHITWSVVAEREMVHCFGRYSSKGPLYQSMSDHPKAILEKPLGFLHINECQFIGLESLDSIGCSQIA